MTTSPSRIIGNAPDPDRKIDPIAEGTWAPDGGVVLPSPTDNRPEGPGSRVPVTGAKESLQDAPATSDDGAADDYYDHGAEQKTRAKLTESADSTTSNNRTILVTGLPLDLPRKHLRAMLAEFGSVVSLRLFVRDQRAVDRGFTSALALFEAHEAAVRAVKGLRGMRLAGNHQLQVHMAINQLAPPVPSPATTSTSEPSQNGLERPLEDCRTTTVTVGHSPYEPPRASAVAPPAAANAPYQHPIHLAPAYVARALPQPVWPPAGETAYGGFAPQGPAYYHTHGVFPPPPPVPPPQQQQALLHRSSFSPLHYFHQQQAAADGPGTIGHVVPVQYHSGQPWLGRPTSSPVPVLFPQPVVSHSFAGGSQPVLSYIPSGQAPPQAPTAYTPQPQTAFTPQPAYTPQPNSYSYYPAYAQPPPPPAGYYTQAYAEPSFLPWQHATAPP